MKKLNKLLSFARNARLEERFDEAEYLLQDAIQRAHTLFLHDEETLSDLYDEMAAVLVAQGRDGTPFSLMARTLRNPVAS